MKKLLIILFSILISSNSYGDSSVSGKMQCTITGQKILGSRLGETQEFESFQGGVEVNDPLELIYSVHNNGDFCLSLYKSGYQNCTDYEFLDVNPFTAIIPFAVINKSQASENSVLNRWDNIFLLWIKPDDILATFYEKSYFRLSQYGDNWDGVFTEFFHPENYVRVLTFNCGNSSGDNVQKLTNSMYTKFK